MGWTHKGLTRRRAEKFLIIKVFFIILDIDTLSTSGRPYMGAMDLKGILSKLH